MPMHTCPPCPCTGEACDEDLSDSELEDSEMIESCGTVGTRTLTFGAPF